MQGGYHGRTYGSMAVTSSKTIYRQMYGPLIPGVHIADYPYCLQCDVRKAMPSSDYTVCRSQRSVVVFVAAMYMLSTLDRPASAR